LIFLFFFICNFLVLAYFICNFYFYF